MLHPLVSIEVFALKVLRFALLKKLVAFFQKIILKIKSELVIKIVYSLKKVLNLIYYQIV